MPVNVHFNAKPCVPVEEIAKEKAYSLNLFFAKQKEQAQNAPYADYSRSNYYNGEYLTNGEMNDKVFKVIGKNNPQLMS